MSYYFVEKLELYEGMGDEYHVKVSWERRRNTWEGKGTMKAIGCVCVCVEFRVLF